MQGETKGRYRPGFRAAYNDWAKKNGRKTYSRGRILPIDESDFIIADLKRLRKQGGQS